MTDTETEIVHTRILESFGIWGQRVYYRVRINSTVKYFILQNATYPLVRRYSSYYPKNPISGDPWFGPLPDGDWNIARLVHDYEDDKLVVTSLEREGLQDSVEAWSGLKVEHENLVERTSTLNQGITTQYEAYLGHTGMFAGIPEVGAPLVITFIDAIPVQPTSFLERENNIRRLLRDTDLTQRTLGHLTENDTRVIGFMLEPIESRPARIEDLDLCRAALRKLHERGIAHGNIDPKTFLVVEDGSRAILHRFQFSIETSDQRLLAREMAEVEQALRQPLDEPMLSEDLNQKLNEITDRDGGVHPVVIWEAFHEHQVTITEEEHVALLESKIAKNIGPWGGEKEMEVAREARRKNGGRWVPY